MMSSNRKAEISCYFPVANICLEEFTKYFVSESSMIAGITCRRKAEWCLFEFFRVFFDLHLKARRGFADIVESYEKQDKRFPVDLFLETQHLPYVDELFGKIVFEKHLCNGCNVEHVAEERMIVCIRSFSPDKMDHIMKGCIHFYPPFSIQIDTESLSQHSLSGW